MSKEAYIGLPQTCSPIGDMSVGSIVKLTENGIPAEYIIVNQGIPGNSSLYDSSCNGTWLLRKDCYEKRRWHSDMVNDYANSEIHNYLNTSFLGVFDNSIQSRIVQVKLPYRAGSGYSSIVTSGSNGLPAKIFLLSAQELSFNHGYMPTNEGVELSYFAGAPDLDTDTSTKRIAYLNGTSIKWWLRTPQCWATNGSSSALYVGVYGDSGGDQCTYTGNGIRPALVLPSNTGVAGDGTVIGADAGTVSVAREVPKTYLGINDVARLCIKGYIGVNGVAREIFSLAEYKRYTIKTNTTYTSNKESVTLQNTNSSSTSQKEIFRGTANSPHDLVACYASSYKFENGVYTLQNATEARIAGSTGSTGYIAFGSNYNWYMGATVIKTTPVYIIFDIGVGKAGGSGKRSSDTMYYFPKTNADYASIHLQNYNTYSTPSVGAIVGLNKGSYDKFTSTPVTSHSQGDYVDTIYGEPGQYPDDGISGDYWYVKQ